MGEINIFNGGYRMNYLAMNGQVQSQNYVYYLFDTGSGTKEIPAYCVTPNQPGVQKVVEEGESIRYLAEEKSSDPKVVGIVASGYPTRPLSELGLENKYQGFYATKMALWSYLISDWDINKLTVNPNLSGDEAERAKKILAAAKDIYAQGTAWNDMKSPEVTCTPDRDTAYEVTIDGKQYKQQEFTVWSKTWVNNYAINIAFTDPASVPAGTRIVDENNQDITSIKAEWMNNGHGGTFKVLYPVESIQGQAGSVQLSLNCEVYAYAVFFASCLEKDEYGNLQNYVVDTDPTTTLNFNAISSYADTPEKDPPDIVVGITICCKKAVFDGAAGHSSNKSGKCLPPIIPSTGPTIVHRAVINGYSQRTYSTIRIVYYTIQQQVLNAAAQLIEQRLTGQCDDMAVAIQGARKIDGCPVA